MSLKSIVAVFLLAFIFVFGTVVLFGLVGAEGWTPQAKLNFEIIYFALVFAILGTVYLANWKKVPGKAYHALLIMTLLLVSLSFTHLASATKSNYESVKDTYNKQLAVENEIQYLEQQNTYYNQAFDGLLTQTAVMRANNNALSRQIDDLKDEVAKRDALIAARAKKAAEEQAALEAEQAALAEQQALEALLAQYSGGEDDD